MTHEPLVDHSVHIGTSDRRLEPSGVWLVFPVQELGAVWTDNDDGRAVDAFLNEIRAPQALEASRGCVALVAEDCGDRGHQGHSGSAAFATRPPSVQFCPNDRLIPQIGVLPENDVVPRPGVADDAVSALNAISPLLALRIWATGDLRK